jgi:hypothetical protein
MGGNNLFITRHSFKSFIVCPVFAYTLIEIAKLNGVGPQSWLTGVLGRLAENEITKLMPFGNLHSKPVYFAHAYK